ncbi:uncharacterized protein VICG_00451 [Vittaforma corneae ATCC 50505]|uniref:Uncharacterized protein n=1 Tax=Vittaforma corneae (strain ATCC 50505) TaxID=993615 RepID=L2GN77_VITCO|nr:uncharacterized protein VICG_00451 [Vittaforma corneae ATCC 50505]ELA42353.1 hypothetical protein VICG_00451 [Vittaforma corneae ATCC 50505]
MKQSKPIILKEAFFTLFISLLIVLCILSIHLISGHFGITKKVMLSIIYASYITHLFLYLLEIPAVQIILSFSVEVFLHRLLNAFPDINIKSFGFYYSFVVFIVNEILMLLYLVNSSLGVPEMIICFLVTSMAPLTFFYYTGGITTFKSPL